MARAGELLARATADFRGVARLVVLGAAQRLVRGEGCQCPICGLEMRRFLPFGVGLTWRRGALCPGCTSLERHRLIWLGFHERLERERPRTLHVAPEPCLEPRLRALLGADYVTTDLKDSHVDVRASLAALPFDPGSFDAVICSHVLEHVPDDRRAMAELYRVLRPGGWAVLQVPLDPRLIATDEDPKLVSARERRRRFGQHDHVRAYGADYAERLRENGFEVSTRPVDAIYDSATVRRFGLDAHELVHACRRP